MKAVIVKAHGDFKVGDEIEVKAEQFAILAESDTAVTASEWKNRQAIQAAEGQAVKARETRVDQAIAKAIEAGSILPKADITTIRAHALTMEAVSEGVGVEFIGNLPVKAKDLSERIVHSVKDNLATDNLTVTASLDDCAQGVLKCTEPQNNLIKGGNWKKAAELAKEAASILKNRMMAPIKAGGDYMLRDTVKGATFTDPNGSAGTAPNVGSLAGDLVIMRNLGYLVNKLPWIKKLTTDMTGEPVKFGQSILTRYITPPGVLTWVPGVGFTSDAATIAMAMNDGLTGGSKTTAQIAASTQSGNISLNTAIVSGGASGSYTGDNMLVPKKSLPLTTDRTVTLNMFKATEIEFPVSLLSGTVRNLFGEQLGAQTYALAEVINQHVLGMFAAPGATQYATGVAWSGTKTTYTKALANWSLAGMIGVKNAMTISKIPDTGRFVLLHSFYHDKLLEDSNLLSAKAIMSLIHKDEAEFNTGDLPTLFGLQVLESQLASWAVGNGTTTGALTSWTDDTTLGSTDAVGFAGNQSSGLFVSRPPQDFTAVATSLGIPITASVRLMTEPDSGLTVMVFSYLDNGKMSINQRVCVMWGVAQGDPRVGITIKSA